jgi:uridylate kinase
MKKLFVMSLGGSIVAPQEGIDVPFLKQLKEFLARQTKAGQRFVLVVGGGALARQYQQAIKAVAKPTAHDLDWIGIRATRVNSELVRAILGRLAHPEIFTDPTKMPKNLKAKIVLAAGWKPGWSTDYVATLIAKRLGGQTVINLSNTDYLYTADPRKDSKAKPIKNIAWKEYLKKFCPAWRPGLNLPFDPVASKLASRSGIGVVMLNGKKLNNLRAFLDGKQFKGTTVE